MNVAVNFANTSTPITYLGKLLESLAMETPNRPYNTTNRPKAICDVYLRGSGRYPIGELLPAEDNKKMIYVEWGSRDFQTGGTYIISRSPEEFAKTELKLQKPFNTGTLRSPRIFRDMLEPLDTHASKNECVWAQKRQRQSSLAELKIA